MSTIVDRRRSSHTDLATALPEVTLEANRLRRDALYGRLNARVDPGRFRGHRPEGAVVAVEAIDIGERRRIHHRRRLPAQLTA